MSRYVIKFNDGTYYDGPSGEWEAKRQADAFILRNRRHAKATVLHFGPNATRLYAPRVVRLKPRKPKRTWWLNVNTREAYLDKSVAESWKSPGHSLVEVVER